MVVIIGNHQLIANGGATGIGGVVDFQRVQAHFYERTSAADAAGRKADENIIAVAGTRQVIANGVERYRGIDHQGQVNGLEGVGGFVFHEAAQDDFVAGQGEIDGIIIAIGVKQQAAEGGIDRKVVMRGNIDIVGEIQGIPGGRRGVTHPVGSVGPIGVGTGTAPDGLGGHPHSGGGQ